VLAHVPAKLVAIDVWGQICFLDSISVTWLHHLPENCHAKLSQLLGRPYVCQESSTAGLRVSLGSPTFNVGLTQVGLARACSSLVRVASDSKLVAAGGDVMGRDRICAIRIGPESEPRLSAVVQALPKGTMSAFFREVLICAEELGWMTEEGFELLKANRDLERASRKCQQLQQKQDQAHPMVVPRPGLVPTGSSTILCEETSGSSAAPESEPTHRSGGRTVSQRFAAYVSQVTREGRGDGVPS